MGNGAPIQVVQATRPILILDEPQNMVSELRVNALAQLHPLFALRYSATHRDPYNLVYRLTPYDAYRLRLVKQIAVASVLTENDRNHAFIRVVSTNARLSRVSAKLAIHVLTPDGTVKEKVRIVQLGTQLANVANRPVYAGFEVSRIDIANKLVSFSNGVEIHEGEAVGQDKLAIFDAQILRALMEHFKKQEALAERGVKVLTLFFIDKVSNYANGGIIRQIFDRRFEEVKVLFDRWRNTDSRSAQAAYFAQKRRKGGEVEMIDSNAERPKAEDEAAFNLIMRHKERLLQLEEPVSFIFSHSALREGWDNPNIFQIVTLNQSVSDIKKRQEIGRGLRLAVDQDGERVHDAVVNTLTVIVNESYQDYVGQLQAQLDEDGENRADQAPLPRDANKDQSMALRQEVFLSEEFKHLWSQVSRRTRYQVSIGTDRIVEQVVRRLNAAEFRQARIAITTANVVMENDNTLRTEITDASVRSLSPPSTIPNLLQLICHQLEHTTPRMRVTRHTLFRILELCKPETLLAAMNNPQEFALDAARTLKDVLADELVDGIKYSLTGESYTQDLIIPTEDGYLGQLMPVNHSVTDKVPVGSNVERNFVQELDSRRDVPLFVKLPPGFLVPTPVGNYNPDWALIMERHGPLTTGDRPVMYLVRETKSTTDPNQLRSSEARKIRCGEAHFQRALGIDFASVTDADGILRG
jgi:type III restriction enzyme